MSALPLRLTFSSLDGTCFPILAIASAGSLRSRSHLRPVSMWWMLALDAMGEGDDDSAIAEDAALTRMSSVSFMMIPKILQRTAADGCDDD